MNEFEKSSTEFFPCNECRTGNLQPRRVTYFTWIGSQLISVPHFPAWICDVCGRREYDMKAVLWLEMILDPNAGKPTKKRRGAAPPPRPKSDLPRPVRDS
jgi:YgiT-type zinc finger domain-containing protein